MNLDRNTLLVLCRDNGYNYKHCHGFFIRDNKLYTYDDVYTTLLKLLEKPSDNTIKECITYIIKLHTDNTINPRELFLQKWDYQNAEPSDLLTKLWRIPNLSTVLHDIIFDKSQYAYFFYGVPRAGKSMLIQWLHHVFENYYTVMKVTDFNGGFGMSGLDASLLNASGDLGAEHIDATRGGHIKDMITGEELTCNKKYVTPFKIRSQANFVFGCNRRVSYDMGDSGNHRRFIEVYFDKEVELFTDYATVMEMLKASTPGILKWLTLNARPKEILRKMALSTAWTLLEDMPDDYNEFSIKRITDGKSKVSKTTFNDMLVAKNDIMKEMGVFKNESERLFF